MVDKPVLARKLAAIRDAVARVREVLPESAEALSEDRTAREVVVLNLFIALQEAIARGAHWLADEGWEIPETYGEAFVVLADHGILERDLARRLRAASGLRNLIAHQYAAIDTRRLFDLASNDIEDLLTFCRQLAQQVDSRGEA